MPTEAPQYPGANPTVAGNKITVERFVKSPSTVFKVLSDLSKERYIADFIFASGDAQGGAVLYDETEENDLYAEGGANGGDPSIIAPGDEFPIVGDSQGDPRVAAVTKRGSAFPLTYEAVRRDQRDVLGRGLIKLRNSSIRKHDTVAVQALSTHPRVRTATAAEAWSGSTEGSLFADVFGAKYAVEQADLGYIVDTAILNPQDALKMIKRKDVREALPRENATLNPILSGELAGLCGVDNWMVTNRATAGVVTFLQSKVAGSQRDEVPFYTRTVNQEVRERWLLMAGRVGVPIVTDPLAVIQLRGV